MSEPYYKAWDATSAGDDNIFIQKQRAIIQASFQAALDTSLDYERKGVWD